MSSLWLGFLLCEARVVIALTSLGSYAKWVDTQKAASQTSATTEFTQSSLSCASFNPQPGRAFHVGRSLRQQPCGLRHHFPFFSFLFCGRGPAQGALVREVVFLTTPRVQIAKIKNWLCHVA